MITKIRKKEIKRRDAEVEAVSATVSPKVKIAKSAGKDGHLPTRGVLEDAHQTPPVCPYCESTDFVKRGLRKNKFGVAQLYICRNPVCGRTFTAKDIKGKKFPLKIVIECMSHYNLGFTFEQTCSIVKQKFGAAPDPPR